MEQSEVLLMFATALKDLAVELDVCLFTSTQVNAKADDNTNIRNEASLAGGRSTINKADYGCIMARPTKEELEILQKIEEINLEMPNLVTDMFKVRDGQWTQVRIWSYMDLGILRKKDLYVTDSQLEPIPDFFNKTKFKVENWEDDKEKEILNLVDKFNKGN